MSYRDDDGHHYGDMPRWMNVLLLVLVALLVVMAVIAAYIDHARSERERTELVR